MTKETKAGRSAAEFFYEKAKMVTLYPSEAVMGFGRRSRLESFPCFAILRSFSLTKDIAMKRWCWSSSQQIHKATIKWFGGSDEGCPEKFNDQVAAIEWFGVLPSLRRVFDSLFILSSYILGLYYSSAQDLKARRSREVAETILSKSLNHVSSPCA